MNLTTVDLDPDQIIVIRMESATNHDMALADQISFGIGACLILGYSIGMIENHVPDNAKYIVIEFPEVNEATAEFIGRYNTPDKTIILLTKDRTLEVPNGLYVDYKP